MAAGSFPSYHSIPIGAWVEVEKYRLFEAEYGCSVCSVLKPDVYTTDPCDHMVCDTCAVSLTLCPVCQTALTGKKVNKSDYLSRKVSAELRLACCYHSPEEKSSCSESKLPFGQWMQHCTLQCSLRPVRCEHCSASFPALHKHKHQIEECPLRSLKCGDCSAVVAFAQLGEHKLTKCAGSVVPCSNGDCKETFKRDDTATHRRTCPHEVIPCIMAQFGCTHHGMRKDLNQHLLEGVSTHMTWLVHQNALLEAQLFALRSEAGHSTPSIKKEAPALSPGVNSNRSQSLERWLFLIHIIDQLGSKSGLYTARPMVLAADRNKDWFLAEVKERKERRILVSYLGFDGEDEWLDIYGGRVRPVCDSRKAHNDFVLGLKEGSTVDFRDPTSTNSLERCVWRRGRIITVTSSHLHISDLKSTNKYTIPLTHRYSAITSPDTVYNLCSYDPELHPSLEKEFPGYTFSL